MNTISPTLPERVARVLAEAEAAPYDPELAEDCAALHAEIDALEKRLAGGPETKGAS